ncbi:MAG TPA: kelch repeat-containing protein [Actinomycetota bacterium]|nr:kelch repeat-containing protein [Actinomycetota bacterium]
MSRRRRYGFRGRGSLSAAVALVLLASILSGCRQTGPSAAGPTSSTSPPPVTATSSAPTPSVTPASWRRIAHPPYTDGSVAWSGQEVFLVHAWPTWDKATNVTHCIERVAAYTPSTDSWRTLPPGPAITPHECRWGGGADAAVWTGDELVLWGATNAAYDPTTNSWRRLTAPPPMDDLTPEVTVWTGRQMLGWGYLDCCDISSPEGSSLTPATGVQRRLPRSPLQGGAAPMGVWTGSELIIAGGGYEGGYVYDDVAAYRPATRSWRTLAPMPIARMEGTALWDGTELLIFDGIGGRNLESGRDPNLRTRQLARGVAYNPTTDRWRWLSAPEQPRVDAAYAWDGHEVLMWGGIGLDRSIPSHGEAFDPATNTWSPLPASPLRARVWPTAVWTDGEWIIWGGGDARSFAADGDWKPLTDGAAFTPASTSR